MAKTKVYDLKNFGQSLWLDFIERKLIASGELRRMVEDDGLAGLTSNPTIFKAALEGSTEYDESCRSLMRQNAGSEAIYDQLTREDIATAADVLKPVYDETGGADGFASIEVLASYARDIEMTIAEARRLFGQVGRDNVMVKVPGTPEGAQALRRLTGEGHNINVTLLFSVEQYERIANAYIDGLEMFAQSGGDLRGVVSVASFFLSRIDTKVDAELDRLKESADVPAEACDRLRGTAAIATAKATYERFAEIFGSERFQRLREKGARVQRPLWASMSTKDPSYPDTKYVQALIGPDTVVTVPKTTLVAMRDHLEVKSTLQEGIEEATRALGRFEEVGIDLRGIYEGLQVEGIGLFDRSYSELLRTLDAKRGQLMAA